MNKESWVDIIVEAMKSLGGDTIYKELYPEIERIRKEKNIPLTPEWKASVRRTIEDHSSDSDNFRAENLFIKLGRGHWGLRNKFIPPLEDITVNDVAGEDAKQLSSVEEVKIKKMHYMYEGRLKASEIREIKRKQGYVCRACGMSFSDRYPSIGENFIECHHKIPYAQIKEGEERILNTDDFVVLCSNCHSMIHRLENPADVEKLKEILSQGIKQ